MRRALRFVGMLLITAWAPLVEQGEPSFPTFEPFSGFESPWGAEAADRPSVEEVLARMREKIPEALRFLEDLAVQEARDEESSPDESRGEQGYPSALLSPDYDDATRAWLLFVPRVFGCFELIWNEPTWGKSEAELANLLTDYLSASDRGIQAIFEPGRDEMNRKELQRLAVWFHALTADRDAFAVMVRPLPANGPFIGLPIELPLSAKLVSSHALDDRIELRLYELSQEREPFVLQGFVDGALSWTRQFSDSPARSIRKVELSDDRIVPLGSYGWKSNLGVEYVSGDQYGELFIGKNGEFLFYFLSW